jgi:hypothetical protein
MANVGVYIHQARSDVQTRDIHNLPRSGFGNILFDGRNLSAGNRDIESPIQMIGWVDYMTTL